MISMPTSEFVTVLSGALGFAPVAKTEMYGIHILWDGEALHASGYDVLSGARVSWWDGAGREGIHDDEDSAVSVPVTYGGGDAPWRAFIAYEDAKDLVKVFKLAAKFWWVPVNIKITPTGHRLIVERSPEYGKPEASIGVNSDVDVAAKFPDVRYIADRVLRGSHQLMTDVQFAPHRLAAFGTVAVGDVMKMTFGVADDGDPAVVEMGPRVVGFIHPVGTQRSAAKAMQEPNFLRDATGVHVSGSAVEESGGAGDTDPLDLAGQNAGGPIHKYDGEEF